VEELELELLEALDELELDDELLEELALLELLDELTLEELDVDELEEPEDDAPIPDSGPLQAQRLAVASKQPASRFDCMLVPGRLVDVVPV
jgi:hypothetical protein